jgi:Glu-tRNA(Gln) amidotransferase subunit E-like FAD-binding protein
MKTQIHKFFPYICIMKAMTPEVAEKIKQSPIKERFQILGELLVDDDLIANKLYLEFKDLIKIFQTANINCQETDKYIKNDDDFIQSRVDECLRIMKSPPQNLKKLVRDMKIKEIMN